MKQPTNNSSFKDEFTDLTQRRLQPIICSLAVGQMSSGYSVSIISNPKGYRIKVGRRVVAKGKTLDELQKSWANGLKKHGGPVL